MRHADHEIDPMFLLRWSPRAMSGAEVVEADLLRLLEAARWAPSSGNDQPWRFVYARSGTAGFDRLLDTAVAANQVWCVRAGALVLVLSRGHRENGEPAPTHAFDTGAAWMSLALQGSRMGLVVHGMAGFDHGKASLAVGAPAGHVPHCLVAVGHPGRVEDLPERLRIRETPNGRHPVSAIAFEGRFPA